LKEHTQERLVAVFAKKRATKGVEKTRKIVLVENAHLLKGLRRGKATFLSRGEATERQN